MKGKIRLESVDVIQKNQVAQGNESFKYAKNRYLPLEPPQFK